MRRDAGHAGHAGGGTAFHLMVWVAGIGMGLTAPFTALLVVALGGSPQEAAVVVSSMGFSLLLVDFFGTRWVPRLYSRGSLTASMLIFGLGSLLTALTTVWQIVWLARVLQGFGTALFMSGGLQLAVRTARDGARTAAIGAFNAAWFAGIAIGPLGGGLIAGLLPGPDGLRLLFGVCAGINLLAAAVAWGFAPRVRSPLPARLGLPHGLGVRGARTWGVLTLAGFGQAVRSGLAMTLVPLAGEGLRMGWSVFGLALGGMALTDVLTMHLGSRWAQRFGGRPILAAALLWGVAATAVLALVRTPAGFVVGALALGVTVGAVWVLPTAMAVELSGPGVGLRGGAAASGAGAPVDPVDPVDRTESAVAANRIAADIGMLAGGLLAAAALSLAGLHGALLAAAGLQLGAVVLTVLVGDTRRRPVPPEVVMPLPSPEELAVFLANQDLSLAPDRLASAHRTHADYRADLERLRAIPLSFVDPVSEPAAATRWIATGGRS
jgi:MFS family permease